MITPFVKEKKLSGESPTSIQSNELIFKYIKQIFTNRFINQKSYKKHYAINFDSLDWATYALHLKWLFSNKRKINQCAHAEAT